MFVVSKSREILSAVAELLILKNTYPPGPPQLSKFETSKSKEVTITSPSLQEDKKLEIRIANKSLFIYKMNEYKETIFFIKKLK